MIKPAARAVHAKAPGKINVFLKVGTLSPDGYHDVAIAYQAVSLYEEVRVVEADDFSVEVSGTVELSRVPTDGANIAIKAARLLAARTGYPRGAHIELAEARAGHRRDGRRIRGCRGHPARLRRPVGHRAPARGDARPGPQARRGCAVRLHRRHRDRHRPRRRALAGARPGHLPLGARPRRLRPLDPGRLPRARRAPGAARAGHLPGRPAADRRQRRAAGPACGRPAHARERDAQRPAGARAPPRALARRRARARRAERRPRRASSRGRARPWPSSPRMSTRPSSCRSPSRRRGSTSCGRTARCTARRVASSREQRLSSSGTDDRSVAGRPAARHPSRPRRGGRRVRAVPCASPARS